LLLLCLVLGVFAQNQKSVLDDYTVASPSLVIVISDSSPLPTTVSNFVQDSSILGGERDLILTATTGPAGRVLTTSVSGAWNLGTPNGVTGVASIQYDGIDGSANLNTKGLGGVDLTKSGADSFQVTIQTDLTSTYVISVTDMKGATSSLTFDIQGDPGISDIYYGTFKLFTGNADFTNVGAIELQIQGVPNLETSVQLLALASTSSGSGGPVPKAATASPTPAAVGNTWYRFDDDDNEQSPCGEDAQGNTVFLADNNIIYYYFYGLQRPYIYVSKDLNDATLLIPSIFACIFALFAL